MILDNNLLQISDLSESESIHKEESDGNTGRDPWLEAEDTDTSDEEVSSSCR